MDSIDCGIALGADNAYLSGKYSAVIGGIQSTAKAGGIAIGSLSIADQSGAVAMISSSCHKSNAIALVGANIASTELSILKVGNILNVKSDGRAELGLSSSYIAPVNDMDIATKKYVDDQTSGGSGSIIWGTF